MTYIPHSPKERDAMLETIGVKKLADLFEAVPAKHRFPNLDLPPAITEMEAAAELGELAAANESTRDLVSFLGAGMYNHYIPSVVDHILRRGEFYTAYTPYQPEISQGTLQGIFEYQSLMAALTGMEVSNASHYDGATAAAEAVNLAWAQFRGKRTKVVISPTVHPQYREVIRTYTKGMDLELAGDNGQADLETGPENLMELVDDNTMLIIVQYPDFFGRIYDYTKLIDLAHENGALVCVVANPTALAVQNPRRNGRGRGRWRRPTARHPDVVRRPLPGLLHHPQEIRPQNGRAPGRRDSRQPRAAGLRPNPDRPRTAHQA
jgi:glycine dehydrogenase subunit 1